jgi:hypothetical protein
LPGWWLGEADGRIEEPYISPASWEVELRQAGFELEAMKWDNEINASYIARPAAKSLSTKRVTILRGNNKNVATHELVSALRGTGWELDFCTLDMTPPAQQKILSVLDLEAPFFSDVDSMRFLAFRDFLKRIDQSSLLWVTRAAQIKCKDPGYAMVLGTTRSIRIESKIDIATLELENFDQQAWSATCTVLENFERRLDDPNTEPVVEYIHSDGYIKTSKFHWIKIADELKEPIQESQPQRLEIGQLGALQTLHWKQYTFPELQDDHVEVDVKAVGMNFRVCDELRCKAAENLLTR